MNTEAAPAPAPAPETNSQPFPIVEMCKKYYKFILAGLALFALILAIVNFTGSYDVKATAKFGDYKQSSSGPVSDLYDEDEFAMLTIGSYIFALGMLAAAAVAVLGALKAFNVSNVVDNVLKGNKEFKELFLFGIIGAIASVIQIVSYFLSVQESFGAKISVSAPWFSWVVLLISAGIIAFDKMVVNKR